MVANMENKKVAGDGYETPEEEEEKDVECPRAPKKAVKKAVPFRIPVFQVRDQTDTVLIEVTFPGLNAITAGDLGHVFADKIKSKGLWGVCPAQHVQLTVDPNDIVKYFVRVRHVTHEDPLLAPLPLPCPSSPQHCGHCGK